jgi:hypothetical protein
MVFYRARCDSDAFREDSSEINTNDHWEIWGGGLPVSKKMGSHDKFLYRDDPPLILTDTYYTEPDRRGSVGSIVTIVVIIRVTLWDTNRGQVTTIECPLVPSRTKIF